eukprot:4922617-Prymnesium_polylepis.1
MPVERQHVRSRPSVPRACSLTLACETWASTGPTSRPSPEAAPPVTAGCCPPLSTSAACPWAATVPTSRTCHRRCTPSTIPPSPTPARCPHS